MLKISTQQPLESKCKRSVQCDIWMQFQKYSNNFHSSNLNFLYFLCISFFNSILTSYLSVLCSKQKLLFIRFEANKMNLWNLRLNFSSHRIYNMSTRIYQFSTKVYIFYCWNLQFCIQCEIFSTDIKCSKNEVWVFHILSISDNSEVRYW